MESNLFLCSWGIEKRKAGLMLKHYKKVENILSANLKLIIEVFERKGIFYETNKFPQFWKNIKQEIDSILISNLNSEKDIIIWNFICEHYYEIEIYISESLMPLFDTLDSEELNFYKRAKTICLLMLSDKKF